MSNYDAAQIWIDNHDGTLTAAVSATVKAWDVDADMDLGVSLLTDGDGILAAGTLAVAVGTVVRFRVENFHGRAGFAEVTTT